MSRFESRSRCIGVLTSGGDCPGLNAAIRGITKSAIQDYGIKVVRLRNGAIKERQMKKSRFTTKRGAK